MLTTLQVAGNSCTSELNILQQGVEICDAARREDLQAVKALLSAKTHVHIKNSQVRCRNGLGIKWLQNIHVGHARLRCCKYLVNYKAGCSLPVCIIVKITSLCACLEACGLANLQGCGKVLVFTLCHLILNVEVKVTCYIGDHLYHHASTYVHIMRSKICRLMGCAVILLDVVSTVWIRHYHDQGTH